MTVSEFNTKYKNYIEERFYGLAIHKPEVISFLNDYFSTCVRNNVEFKIQQIKLKFGYARVYTSLPEALNKLLEKQIDILTGTTEFDPIITD